MVRLGRPGQHAVPVRNRANSFINQLVVYGAGMSNGAKPAEKDNPDADANRSGTPRSGSKRVGKSVTESSSSGAAPKTKMPRKSAKPNPASEKPTLAAVSEPEPPAAAAEEPAPGPAHATTPSPDEAVERDPFAECLAFLTKFFGRPYTSGQLQAGMELRCGQITMDSLIKSS